MNKEGIIKALECCGAGTPGECNKCPHNSEYKMTSIECAESLIRDAHALIKELNAELDAMRSAENCLQVEDYHKDNEGEWILNKKCDRVCSICGKEPLYRASGTSFATTFYKAKSKFCPHCGAKMKVGE